MTREEAIEINKNLKEYMRISDKTSKYKFLEDNYTALDMAISALERQTVKSCNICKHSDKPYSEEPCKHCCDDVAEKWESEDKE